MKTLKNEIHLAMISGPMSEMEGRVYEAVRMFLADRFCAAILIADEPTRTIMSNLFDRIVAGETLAIVDDKKD